MESAEAETADAEADDGDESSNPAVTFVGCDDAQSKVDRVSCGCVLDRWTSSQYYKITSDVLLTSLHAHETSPRHNTAAVQQSSNDIATK